MSITGSGRHRRSRKRLSVRVSDKGKTDIGRVLQVFAPGDRVQIDPNPAVQKNIPDRRFFGYAGVVVERKGNAYTIKVSDGRKSKMLDLFPMHLKRV